MNILLRALAIGALTLALSACAETAKFDAAGDVHAFLTAIRDGDKAGFNAHVDKAALKTQIRARVMAEMAKRSDSDQGAAVLGALLGRPVVDALADQLIQPDVFRAVAEYLGYSAAAPIPNRLVIAQALRPMDADHVCVARGKTGPCVLVFRNEDGVWRLVSFEGDISMLKTKKAKRPAIG